MTTSPQIKANGRNGNGRNTLGKPTLKAHVVIFSLGACAALTLTGCVTTGVGPYGGYQGNPNVVQVDPHYGTANRDALRAIGDITGQGDKTMRRLDGVGTLLDVLGW